MPAEIELKLAIDPKHAVRVASLPALQARAGRPTTQKLTSIYFDTPENALLRDGWALRLRRAGRAWVQTLKGEGHAAGGLHAREESEHAIATSELDLYRVESGELRKRLLKWRNAGTLVPRFRTEFRRTAWLVEMPGGDRVECALDRGVVRTQDGKRSEPICEIELELKQGNAGALFELARELARHLPYELEDRSKADRGYALAGGTVAAVAAAPVLRLARDARGGDAFAA